MDKEKANLIFDKMEEIRKIVKTEPNNTYLTMFFSGGYMAFNNDPGELYYYSFYLRNGEINKVR